MDAEVLEGILDAKNPESKSKEIEIKLIARLRKHKKNPKFIEPGERLEKLKEKHEQGLLPILNFLKELLTLAKEVAKAEKQVDPEYEQHKAKAALTVMFHEVKMEKHRSRSNVSWRALMRSFTLFGFPAGRTQRLASARFRRPFAR